MTLKLTSSLNKLSNWILMYFINVSNVDCLSHYKLHLTFV